MISFVWQPGRYFSYFYAFSDGIGVYCCMLFRDHDGPWTIESSMQVLGHEIDFQRRKLTPDQPDQDEESVVELCGHIVDTHRDTFSPQARVYKIKLSTTDWEVVQQNLTAGGLRVRAFEEITRFATHDDQDVN
jgi:hypothetical protein